MMQIINASQFVKNKDLIGKPVFIDVIRAGVGRSQVEKLQSSRNLRYGLITGISEFEITVLLFDKQHMRINIMDVVEENIKIKDLKIIEENDDGEDFFGSKI